MKAARCPRCHQMYGSEDHVLELKPQVWSVRFRNRRYEAELTMRAVGATGPAALRQAWVQLDALGGRVGWYLLDWSREAT